MTTQYFIYGRVQGVGFRYFTWREAEKLGICGTVRNRQDGSVEVIAQGTDEQMAKFTQWLQQGPKTAKVERVIAAPYHAIESSCFSVIR